MLTLAFFIIMLAYFVATNFFLRALPERLFILIFTISTVYYGILGPWYWAEFRDSTFLGVNWSSEFPSVVFMFVVVYLLVVTTISLVSSKTKRLYFSEYAGDLTKRRMSTIYLFLSAGFAACGYVYFVGGSLKETEAIFTDDALLNIFFQLSDVLIGVLLFWAATKGFDKKWFMFALMFVLYAVMSGFRSKLVLLLAPITIYMYFQPRKNQIFVRVVTILVSMCMVAFFSVMSLVRNKFSGLDFDMLSDANIDLYLYGLFADTNIIFGLSSCLVIFGQTVPFAGFDPFTDVLVQFIPRVIYPEKNLYLHLREVAWWIGNSEESLKSGTAIPFFGEYYAAFGWLGVVLLVVIYAIVTLWLFRFIRRYSVTNNQYLMGVALVAVFVGYYYYSRGSIAQITKGLIFACGPFLYLLRTQKVGRIKSFVLSQQKYKHKV